MTSQLRHHYVVSCKYWSDVLQFFSHTDCQDAARQKLWKVVKICRSYGQNTIGPFFSGHGVHTCQVHVCMSNCCNAIVIARFCWLSGTDINNCQNIRNDLHDGSTRHVSRTTFWSVDTYTHRLDENNILQLLLSPLVNGSLQSAYIITPSPVEKGAISVAFVRPSVSRTQRPSVFKFGTKVPRLRCDSHTSFKVKRSKVTRPINADTHRPP